MRTPPLTSLVIASVNLLLFTQCQNVTPQPPKAEGYDPPVPAARSYLSGSITLPLRELEAKINKELDPVLVGRGSQKDSKSSILPFSLIRSGSVRIQYTNQQVRFSAPLQVQLAKPFRSEANMPSRKPFCAIRVDFMSPLTLTPAWRLSSHVKFAGYQWEVKPQIKLLGKTISLDAFAQNVIQKYQPTIEAAIDSAVYNDLRLDQMAEPIWRSMQKPLLLSQQYGLWLLPRPVSIAASPISGTAEKITTPLLITLDTQTALKPQEPAYTPTALPLLQKRNRVANTSDLRLISFIPYADINRILAQTLRKKRNKLAFGSLTVNRASVYGGQRSVIIKTEVSGLINGTLYLRGRPGFDTTTNTLRISNLDFDTQTQEAIPKLSGTLFHDSLCALLEELLSISLGDEIDQLPRKIDAAFEKSNAGKKTNLTIGAFRFTPRKIAVRADGIQTLIAVQATAGLRVQQL